ncbi:hypothetical protein KA107_02545 [Candidatus Pacearchaeota archaeon]|nr:hypothetical protein [Candidatus Pacearchaeota archaeon]
MESKLSILVGDDQIGIRDSLQQKAFLRNYEGVADFNFENDPAKFVSRAEVGRYDALLIDLNWRGSENSQDTTGLRVLYQTGRYSPKRFLHTSEEINLDLESAVKLVGGTGIIQKHRSREYLVKKLAGGENGKQ